MSSEVDEQAKYPVLDHLRVVEKMLRLTDQLCHGPNSCDRKLVQSYVLQALAHVQAAQRELRER